MSRKKQQQNETMTPMQHRAVLVCILCVLAVLLTFGITTTLLKKEEPAPSVSESVADPTPGEDLSGHYQIDNASTALLTETADAGTDYLNDTLFLGDSNTVRLYNNGLISLQQFCAREGIGTQVALNEGIVTFKGDNNHYTIAQAVAKMKPRRVVMTFGTNDTGMEVQDFISNYTALVQAIQAAYPYTDIIVNTVPPIPENHSSYPHMDQAKIDDFNMALLNMCEQLGLKFLNTAETLKGENGYGNPDYYTDGDIHLKSAGLKAALTYLRTHAYQTEDRRPDTNNIPTRTLEYVSNPSSAVAAPSSEAVSESTSMSESVSESASSSGSESTSTEAKFEARYQVEKSGGGTLTTGDSTGNNSVSYKVNDPGKSITVTAVPAEGHVFVKWSDGVTSKTRTDTNFKQNLDVTAIFGAASVRITSEGHATLGSAYTFKASLNGKYASAENLHWYANGAEIKAAAGMTSITVKVDASMLNTSYKIHAAIVYNGSTVNSNSLAVSIGSGVTSESGSQSGSSSGSTSSSSSSSASSSGSSSSSASSTSEAASSSHTESHSTSASESKAESKSEAASSSEAKSETSSSSKSESASSSENDVAPSASSNTEASASKEAQSTAE